MTKQTFYGRSASNGAFIATTSTTTAKSSVVVRDKAARIGTHGGNAERVERAVYKHLQAQRELGSRNANTREVARALHLPHGEVVRAMGNLSGRGVKVVKR